jgi:paraquat-inducible protein B
MSIETIMNEATSVAIKTPEDVIEFLDREAEELRDRLDTHAILLQALRDLRNRLYRQITSCTPQEFFDEVSETMSEAVEVHRAKQKPAKPKAASPDATLSGVQLLKSRKIAREVADLVKERKMTKTQALRHLSKSGDLGYKVDTARVMINPSRIGHKFHSRLYKGTKYAKQA